jgi:hypothetical protein
MAMASDKSLALAAIKRKMFKDIFYFIMNNLIYYLIIFSPYHPIVACFLNLRIH